MLVKVLLYCSCAILVLYSVYLSLISLIPAVQLFTHSLLSLPTITRSSPEVLIMKKRNAKILSYPEPVQSSPILPSDSTVPRSGTSQTNASCPHSLLFHPDVSSVMVLKPVTYPGFHFQYKMRIWSQEF